MDTKNHKSVKSRRRLLTALASGGGVLAARGALPEKWGSPVVNSVVLPSHAQATGFGSAFSSGPITVADASTLERGRMVAAGGGRNDRSIARRLRDQVVGTANAGGTVIEDTIVQYRAYAELAGSNLALLQIEATFGASCEDESPAPFSVIYQRNGVGLGAQELQMASDCDISEESIDVTVRTISGSLIVLDVNRPVSGDQELTLSPGGSPLSAIHCGAQIVAVCGFAE